MSNVQPLMPRKVFRLRPGPANDRVADLCKLREQIVRAIDAIEEALDETDAAIDMALEEAPKDIVIRPS